MINSSRLSIPARLRWPWYLLAIQMLFGAVTLALSIRYVPEIPVDYSRLRTALQATTVAAASFVFWYLLRRFAKRRWLDVTVDSVQYFEEGAVLWETEWQDVREFYSSKNGWQLVRDDGTALEVWAPDEQWDHVVWSLARPGSERYLTTRSWNHGPRRRVGLSVLIIFAAFPLFYSGIGSLEFWSVLAIGAMILLGSAIMSEYKEMHRARLPDESLLWTKGPTATLDIREFQSMIKDQVR